MFEDLLKNRRAYKLYKCTACGYPQLAFYNPGPVCPSCGRPLVVSKNNWDEYWKRKYEEKRKNV